MQDLKKPHGIKCLIKLILGCILFFFFFHTKNCTYLSMFILSFTFRALSFFQHCRFFFYLHSRHQSHTSITELLPQEKRGIIHHCFSLLNCVLIYQTSKKRRVNKRKPKHKQAKRERENNFGPSSSALLSCLLTFICFCYTHTVSTEKWKTLTKLYFILIMV